MINVFGDLKKEELQKLYDDKNQAEENGLRPRTFDKYIEQIQKTTELPFSVAWKMADDMFMEEVVRRYFSE